MLTARCENLLYGAGDLDDTIARLVAYREAGAEVIYPPGLVEAADITRVVSEIGAPVNVLAFPGSPPIDQLAGLGVRRVSTGGALQTNAYRAMRHDAEGAPRPPAGLTGACRTVPVRVVHRLGAHVGRERRIGLDQGWLRKAMARAQASAASSARWVGREASCTKP